MEALRSDLPKFAMVGSLLRRPGKVTDRRMDRCMSRKTSMYRDSPHKSWLLSSQSAHVSMRGAGSGEARGEQHRAAVHLAAIERERR